MALAPSATNTVPPPSATSVQRAPVHARRNGYSAIGASALSSALSTDSAWGGDDVAAAMALPPSPQKLTTMWPPMPQCSPPPSPPPPEWRHASDHLPTARDQLSHQSPPLEAPPSPPPPPVSMRYFLTYLPPPVPPPWSPMTPLPPPLPRPPVRHFCYPCTGSIGSAVLDFTEGLTGLLFMAFGASLLLSSGMLQDTCSRLASWRGLAWMQRSSRRVAPGMTTQDV